MTSTNQTNIKLFHIIFIVTFLLFLAPSLKSQEGTRPMHSNINYAYPELNNFAKKPQIHAAARTPTASLSLPFFDDFYYASYTQYPNQQLWCDSMLYINTGMPIAPMSIGVATFDGLNKWGFPYTPDFVFPASAANPADTLTSQYINLQTINSLTLQPSDSIALIFYYQLGGNGDSPEPQDSLIVDFYSKDSGWINKVWAKPGVTTSNPNDTLFKRAFIWIDSTIFLTDSFKFRFRNNAATNGNFDNWNIDYVYLDRNRSILKDTAWNDLTIGYVPSSFLKNYSSMPWYQYADHEMANKYSNFIRYNGTTTVNTTYQYQIFDNNNVMVNNASYGASNLAPFRIGGWQHNPVHCNPTLNYTFAPMTDSTDFTIKHFMLNLGGDINIGNDTAIEMQRFRNYYAYDDGSCETGYYVLGLGTRMAYHYSLNNIDTLRALRIYFDPAGAIGTTEQYSFRINVYQDGSSGPGLKLYTDSLMHPIYSTTGINVFAEYPLTTPLILAQGNHYIGIQQAAGDATNFTIGFDRNRDFSSNLYYDSGFGWTQSSTKGSLMMRAVFGQKIVSPVGIKEQTISQSSVKVFPNPASNSISIQNFSEETNINYSIYALDGSIVTKGSMKGSQLTVSTENISNGIYILVLNSQSKNSYRQKLIIQH